MVAEFTIAGGALAHIIRRNIQAAPANLQQLHYHAGSYERATSGMQDAPKAMLPVVIVTGLVILVILATVRYTIGDVMVSLAMIESPSSTAIIEPSPPKYTEDPEFPDEKETAKLLDPQTDVEITIINNKPISSKLRSMSSLLSQIGGPAGRVRGAGWSAFYHFVQSGLTQLLVAAFGFSWVGSVLFSMLSSLLLCRLHMRWTHAMISQSATGPSTRLNYERKHIVKALAVPTIVSAFAQQFTVLAPMAVLASIHAPAPAVHDTSIHHPDTRGCSKTAALQVAQAVAALAIMAISTFALLLPASITLTRVEAALLPADKQAIVPFDHEAIIGEADITTRQGRKTLFRQAWKSVDCATRVRVIKTYVKMVMIQAAIVIVGAHLMVAEFLLIGGGQVGALLSSARAEVSAAVTQAQKQA